mmetsp:Transcript_37728/g.61443  ORF Transcript_37728/g.61443 Transcript_37728/m.61443 type:complete len:226 (-) Transcript_37728:19-696(-)
MASGENLPSPSSITPPSSTDRTPSFAPISPSFNFNALSAVSASKSSSSLPISGPTLETSPSSPKRAQVFSSSASILDCTSPISSSLERISFLVWDSRSATRAYDSFCSSNLTRRFSFSWVNVFKRSFSLRRSSSASFCANKSSPFSIITTRSPHLKSTTDKNSSTTPKDSDHARDHDSCPLPYARLIQLLFSSTASKIHPTPATMNWYYCLVNMDSYRSVYTWQV